MVKGAEEEVVAVVVGVGVGEVQLGIRAKVLKWLE